MIAETRHTKLAQELEEVVSVLKLQYKPQKIILFGSMATNSITEWSDIDLVIIKETSKPFLKRLREVALLCYAPVGIDFLVYTPQEFEQMIKSRNPFIIEEIINKGKLLYDRSISTVA